MSRRWGGARTRTTCSRTALVGTQKELAFDIAKAHFKLVVRGRNGRNSRRVGNQDIRLVASKAWAIWLATEAAVSVLSVDSIIMSKPTGGPKIPQQSGNWDNGD
ncbi:hypothetical protein B0H14DRAFT_3429381 [Mycena olivaceomarginata]|nr:hypothetical protein B0H14DRAFT_3429381 [Mycena olivaceomarginata]